MSVRVLLSFCLLAGAAEGFSSLWVAALSGKARATTATQSSPAATALDVMSRPAGRRQSAGGERSKRQERVGRLVRAEISRILHAGTIEGSAELAGGMLEDDLRRRISVVSADVSPDLRQARIAVSIRAPKNSADGMVDKRRAYSWLVKNTKPIRHTLARKMSHMKSCPNLTFCQVDVAAAVDVMYLIEKVSTGARRENLDIFEGADNFGDTDFDELDDDEDWEEEDDEGFF